MRLLFSYWTRHQRIDYSIASRYIAVKYNMTSKGSEQNTEKKASPGQTMNPQRQPIPRPCGEQWGVFFKFLEKGCQIKGVVQQSCDSHITIARLHVRSTYDVKHRSNSSCGGKRISNMFKIIYDGFTILMLLYDAEQSYYGRTTVSRFF